MSKHLIVPILTVVCLSLHFRWIGSQAVLQQNDKTEYFNYVEAGKVTLEEIAAETNADAAGASHAPPGSGPSDEISEFAYFPSPDDDGTFIRVDMFKDSVMTFHLPPLFSDMRPASLVLSIPGFNFKAPKVVTDDVEFYLYTKKNVEKGIRIFNDRENKESVADFWNPKAQVKILCHGYQSSSQKPFPQLMKNSYLKLTDDLNVILVDWRKVASGILYFEVAKETIGVGQQIASLLKQLLKEELTTLDHVHFIGHSLGAHVGGGMGYTLGQQRLGQVSRITGLDPAGPGFCDGDIGHLQITDAQFVDVIHTDDSEYCKGWWKWIISRAKGKWGANSTFGHANFFPNGGRMQPGCGTGLTDTCSHSRAYYYMEESFNGTSGTTQFKSCECGSYLDYLNGKCDCEETTLVLMGEYTPQKKEGTYFLKTGRKYPFSHVG